METIRLVIIIFLIVLILVASIWTARRVLRDRGEVSTEARLSIVGILVAVIGVVQVWPSPPPPPPTPTPTLTPTNTLTPTERLRTPTATATILPPTRRIPTPPSPIVDPDCESPKNVWISIPRNGDTVRGIVDIRGIVRPRSQGEWYSLFYRPGIVREKLGYQAQNNVPRKATPDYKENVQISFFEFSGDTLEVDNKSLGTWDTTLLPTGWYSLRLWLREVNSQFLACDVYVFVQK
jgi:hypothetical protein